VRTEHGDDVVEVGAAARGDDHLVGLEGAGQLGVQRGQLVQVAADGGEPRGGGVRGHRALVAGDAAQL
jgi:hypothetical protein